MPRDQGRVNHARTYPHQPLTMDPRTSLGPDLVSQRYGGRNRGGEGTSRGCGCVRDRRSRRGHRQSSRCPRSPLRLSRAAGDAVRANASSEAQRFATTLIKDQYPSGRRSVGTLRSHSVITQSLSSVRVRYEDRSRLPILGARSFSRRCSVRRSSWSPCLWRSNSSGGPSSFEQIFH
jgi:hypothetical protein